MNFFRNIKFLYKLQNEEKRREKEKHREKKSLRRLQVRDGERVGDFIKNSCVWELLSEPSLPDQGLCCQPSLQSTSGSKEKMEVAAEVEGVSTSTMRTVTEKGWQGCQPRRFFFRLPLQFTYS